MQMATEMAAKKAEMKAEKTKKIKRKMISIKSEIKSWVDANQLPCDMEERIINCIQHRLEKKKDFDIEKPILHFSKDLITEIKRHLCLPLLKEVSHFYLLLSEIYSHSIENYNYFSWELLN